MGGLLDGGLGPRPAVAVALLGVVAAVGEAQQRGEGAVVLRSLPAREHDFLAKGCGPAGVGGVPLGGRAAPVALGLGRGVEGRQGGELRQLALVELVGVLERRSRDVLDVRNMEGVQVVSERGETLIPAGHMMIMIKKYRLNSLICLIHHHFLVSFHY